MAQFFYSMGVFLIVLAIIIVIVTFIKSLKDKDNRERKISELKKQKTAIQKIKEQLNKEWKE
jgi:uncharacterized membrane protein